MKNLAIFVVHFMDFVSSGKNHENIFSQNAAQIRLVFALHWSIWPSTHWYLAILTKTIYHSGMIMHHANMSVQ